MTIIYHFLLQNIIVWAKKNVYVMYGFQQVAAFNKNIYLVNLE